MTDMMEIRNERLFDADAATLFDAVRDPQKLALWWGPDGFTNRIDAFDFRPGGDWRVTMISPDGQHFDNHLTFTDILPDNRITVLHHGPMHTYRMDMTFKAESGGTWLTWRMLFDATDDNLKLRSFITAANEQNFDRLERLLGKRKGVA